MTKAKPSRQPPVLRQAHKELTRARLVEAAVEVVCARGYSATTIEDISRSAGTTRATFYLHFQNKADVIHEVIHELRRQSHEIYQPLIQAVTAGRRDDIRGWLEIAFDFWERARPYWVAQEEAAAADLDVRTTLTGSFREGVNAIEQGLDAAGRWDPSTRFVRAVLAYSQLESVFRRWVLVGWDIDRAEALEVMTEMWITALFSNTRSSRTARTPSP